MIAEDLMWFQTGEGVYPILQVENQDQAEQDRNEMIFKSLDCSF